MLTLLPFDDFQLCAKVLSDEDLIDQAKAVRKWLKMFRTGEFGGWENHSLKRMWDGEEDNLAFLGYSLGVEVEHRRRRQQPFVLKLRERYPWLTDQAPDPPEWLGIPDLHISHRALLVDLRPTIYSDVFPEVVGGVELAWPN